MADVKKVAVSLEHRFYRYEGEVYTKLSFPYAYWKSYLDYFDEVVVIARVQEISALTNGYELASGPYVTFFDMPYYVGLKGFFMRLPLLAVASCKAVFIADKFILRSGNVSNFIWLFLMVFNKPYLREYPGNIRQGIEGVAGSSLPIRLLASLLDNIAKAQARFSLANSFVSDYCARLYSGSRPSFVFSSFDLTEVRFLKASYELQDKITSIAVVGRLEGEKGHADLIQAAARLGEGGATVVLNIIGDGRQRESLEELARKNRIRCIFHGLVVDRDKLFDIVSKSDIFVIPSHTEGMPRALLEAMAIGMPCVGTAVGGVPEVLSSDALVHPNDPVALALKIKEFSESAELREAQGKRNREIVGLKFDPNINSQKKISFWKTLYE